MKEKLSIIEYKGKKIVFANLSGLLEQEILDSFRDLQKLNKEDLG